MEPEEDSELRFKPKDEEAFAPNNPRGYVAKETFLKSFNMMYDSCIEENSPGLRQGVLSTQQAAREVAACLLDHKQFAGVPSTTLAPRNPGALGLHEVHAKHPAFVNPNKKVRRDIA